jgi:hypothetical protein
MIDFTMPGHLAPVPQNVKASSGPKLTLEPQQGADVMKRTAPRERAPGESCSDVILRLASDAKHREARWRLSGLVRSPSAPNV